MQAVKSLKKTGAVWSKQDYVGAIVEAYEIMEKRKRSRRNWKVKEKVGVSTKFWQKDYSKESNWITWIL